MVVCVQWLDGTVTKNPNTNTKNNLTLILTLNWFLVDSGIPQGSILGPILFLMYINDIPDFCGEDHKIYLYADDAKIYNTITSKEDQLCLQPVIGLRSGVTNAY